MTTTGPDTRLGIVELGELCQDQCSIHLGWFGLLGRRVRDETDLRRQRWYATAAHRHAWHAELWAGRRPAIPHDAVHQLPPPADVDDGGDLAAAYADHLVAQRALLARLRDRVDPDLDPSTRRVIALVDADLADLQSQAPSPA